jgi:hypothetical protein
VVFELTPNATKTAWTETVLYRFCSQAGCRNGAGPFAGLTWMAPATSTARLTTALSPAESLSSNW